MKNKLIKRMYIILIITVLAVSAGVFITVFGLSYNAKLNDFTDKATGVRDFLLKSLEYYDLSDINRSDEIGIRARAQVQEDLNVFLDVGNFKKLYFAVENEFGEIITTLTVENPDGTFFTYVPSGTLYSDLRKSLNEGVKVSGYWMYNTESGRVYTIFWPILRYNQNPVAVVGMEFNADSIYQSLLRMLVYSLIISLAIIILFSAVAYLSMGRATEPIYKKMAYRDFLTGLHNRLAYEQKLVQCESLVTEDVSVTIVMFDVNNLKTINDTMGHKQGDNYIINTAKVISELVGNLGETYRIGGDEFAAILTGRKQTDIDKLLNTLRKENRPVLHKHNFTCAFGAATYTVGIDNCINDLAKRADEAMYNVKRKMKKAC